MARNNTAETDSREKAKKVGAISGLLPFLRPYKKMVVLSILALISTALVSLVLPLAVRRVVDGFSENNITLLDQYFTAAIGLAVALAVGTGLRYYLVSRLGERVVADIRKAVFERVITLSPSFFERIMTGEILSRITTDTTVIQSVIGSSVSVALRNVLLLVGGMILMLFTSAKLTGLVLLIVPAVVLPIVLLGRRLRNLSRENQDWIANSSGTASESLTAVQTVQSYTRERATSDNFNQVTEHAFVAAHRRIGTRAWMTGIVIFLIFTGIVGVLWIGARDVQNGVMSAGLLVQFLIYAILVAGAVGSLSEIWSELLRAAGATERLIELMQTQDSISELADPVLLPTPVKGDISFTDVRFSYPARPDDTALNGVSFTVKHGETVALVGVSGAGKSTVIQLLQRFYDPQKGLISIDGINLRDMQRSAFRKQIALVPQDPVIFATSARENIRFGRIGATDAEVEAAAKVAAADGFLNKLPEGYDTYLGERGVLLSGGQKQRIAIARAILRDAPILLLDEATSELDAKSEQAVQQAVEVMTADRTTLIVAHRLATVKKADRILVFDEGRIVAEGTHKKLVAEGGIYARLAKLQFTDGEQV